LSAIAEYFRLTDGSSQSEHIHRRRVCPPCNEARKASFSMAKTKDRWQPLVRANSVKPLTNAHIETIRQLGGEEAVRKLKAEAATEYWINDLYQVAVHRYDADFFPVEQPMVQLNIRRRDGKPIFRDWRHFQRIKNELVGPECEGVEIYPAESRLVDTSNKFSIWCFTNPEMRVPFGWFQRDVSDDDGNTQPGLRQRKL
jgi:hypothetical protein